MGSNWQSYPSGFAGGGIVGPPSPKTAPILSIEQGTHSSYVGNIQGWKFPLFDEASRAVVRISSNGSTIEDVELFFDDGLTLKGSGEVIGGMTLETGGADSTSFSYSIEDVYSEDLSIQLLYLDSEQGQLFP